MVCAIVSVIGIVCCAAAWGMGVTAQMIEARLPNGVVIGPLRGGNGQYLYTHDENVSCEEDRRDGYPGVTNLDMDIFAGRVDVVYSADAQNVEVKTEGINQKLGLRCYAEGDTLYITSRKKLYHINGVGIGKITIIVPAELRWNKAKLNIEAGALNIEAINAEELDIDVGSGEARIDHFDAVTMNLDCGAGEVTGIGKVLRELDVDCGVGDVQLSLFGKEADYNYEIDCAVGSVKCGERSCSGVGAEKTINHHASGKINVDCGVGSVELNFADDM